MKIYRIIPLVVLQLLLLSSSLCVHAADGHETGWKNSYMNIIFNFLENGNYDKGRGFSLRDINDDNIPELIISEGSSHPSQCRVYTYNDGRLVDLWRYGSYGDLGYNSEKDLLAAGNLHQGYEFENYYRLEGGKMKLLAKFSNNLGAAASEEELYFRFNDQDINAEEYDEALEIYSGNYESLGRDHKLDMNGILNGFSVTGFGESIITVSKVFNAVSLHTLKGLF